VNQDLINSQLITFKLLILVFNPLALNSCLGLIIHEEWNMRRYETIFILDPDLEEEQNPIGTEKVKGIITQANEEKS